MPVDVLAARLQELLVSGGIPGTQLSAKMRTRLETLLRLGALVEVNAGRGRRIEVRDQEALLRWVESSYPSGLSGIAASLSARAESVANHRNTKRGRALEVALVHMRGFGSCRLLRGDIEQPLATQTAAFGAAGVVIEPSQPWQFIGTTLGIVENQEVFMQIERIAPALDAALWSAGPLSGHALKWLQSQAGLEGIHFGDYDPVGLSEYLRYRAALGSRVRLYIPTDLEDRLVRFGQRELLERSSGIFAKVRREADEAVSTVLAIIDRHGLAIEHEALLIPSATGLCHSRHSPQPASPKPSGLVHPGAPMPP